MSTGGGGNYPNGPGGRWTVDGLEVPHMECLGGRHQVQRAGCFARANYRGGPLHAGFLIARAIRPRSWTLLSFLSSAQPRHIGI
jgi:hypothetical protein